jgi:hypothetical protein
MEVVFKGAATVIFLEGWEENKSEKLGAFPKWKGQSERSLFMNNLVNYY